MQRISFASDIQLSSTFYQDPIGSRKIVIIDTFLEAGDTNSPVRDKEFAQFTNIYNILMLFN